ncbi:MAG: DUF1501 domain-containing protein [Planctomycetaceae bacterium]
MSTDLPGRSVPHHQPATSRRDWLVGSGAGFGGIALSALLRRDEARGDAPAPRHPPRARSVIFLFMEGGPSHIDLFDPKPALKRLEGSPLPESFGSVITAMGESRSPILADRRTWRQHGASGIWVSDWLPHTAALVDEIAVIRSCVSDGINHSGGVCQMNTCSVLAGRPSLGAWATYGLGCATDDLPAFVVMQDTAGQVVNGPRNWGAGFMPAVHQATRLAAGEPPIANLRPPQGVSPARQRAKLDLLDRWNRRAAAAAPEQSELEARIRGYELAFRMQAAAPEAIDLAAETAETRGLYGLDEEPTKAFGRTCLMARRLVERGVRFVQLYHGAGSKWDAHAGIEKNHAELCRQVDRPIAGLLSDLRRRGLLDSTLVVWGGEFGRTPMSEQGNGRDHNPTGFTMWMAGAGVPGGTVIGATDEVGLRAVEDRMHVRDLHATIYRLLGLDHLELAYAHQGRPERPTLNEGTPHPRLVGS